MLKNSINKATKAVGNVAGTAIRGAAEGVYKGITGKSEEQIRKDKEVKYLSRRIEEKQMTINSWAWMIHVSVLSTVTAVLFNDYSLNGEMFLHSASKIWPYYAIPIMCYILVRVFSKQIAKETTR